MTIYNPAVNVPLGSVSSVPSGTSIATTSCNTAADGSSTSVGLVVIGHDAASNTNTIYCANFYCTIPASGSVTDVTTQTNTILESYLPALNDSQYFTYCTNSMNSATTPMAATTSAIINAITTFYTGISASTFMGLTPGIYVDTYGGCHPIETGDSIGVPLSEANNESMIAVPAPAPTPTPTPAPAPAPALKRAPTRTPVATGKSKTRK